VRRISIVLGLLITLSFLTPATTAYGSGPTGNDAITAGPPYILFLPQLTRTADQSNPQNQGNPVSISAQNYLTYQPQLKGKYPFQVYGWASDPSLSANPANYDRQLNDLAQISDSGVTKGIIFTSWRTMEAKLLQPGHADYLKSIGVKSFTYNTEGELTPADEMSGLTSGDPAQNSVAIFTRIAENYGFKAVWGPIRSTADNVPNAAVQVMLDAGLSGLGMQEQKFIEAACVADRVAAVRNTITRYKSLANGRPFTFNVQVMPTRCVNGDSYAQSNCSQENINYEYRHCEEFVNEIQALIDSLAIWANGSPADSASDVGRLVNFVTVIK
jgi:hypothetical protein